MIDIYWKLYCQGIILSNNDISHAYTWKSGDQYTHGSQNSRWDQEIIRTLYTTMLKASNQIAIENLVGAGNIAHVTQKVFDSLLLLDPVKNVTENKLVLGRFVVNCIGDSFTDEDLCIIWYSNKSCIVEPIKLIKCIFEDGK